MATPIYSHQFFSTQGSSGTLAYLVPAGFVAIAAALDVYGDVLGICNLFLHNSAGGTIFWENYLPGDRKSVGWRGRQLYNPGEQITVLADCAPLDGLDVSLSGYLLTAA